MAILMHLITKLTALWPLQTQGHLECYCKRPQSKSGQNILNSVVDTVTLRYSYEGSFARNNEQLRIDASARATGHRPLRWVDLMYWILVSAGKS
jgi:hypothetical protein